MNTKKKIRSYDLIDNFDGLCHYISRRLSNRNLLSYTYMNGSFRKAAVLIPLFFKDGQTHILFTKRTEKVEHHKGQISFPGGMHDAEDSSLENTALRETWEEMGIETQDVKILGRIDKFLTNTRFMVSPFVGRFPYPYDFRINKDEIARVIEVPLRDLLKPEIFEIRRIKRDGILWDIHYYLHQSDMIWGVTGFLLSNFLSIIFDIGRMPSGNSHDQ